jgi:hypothetical protein
MTRIAAVLLSITLFGVHPLAAQDLDTSVILPDCQDASNTALDLLAIKGYWNDVQRSYAELHLAQDSAGKSAGRDLIADRLTLTAGVSNKHTLEFVDGASTGFKTSGGPTYGLEYKVPIGAFFDRAAKEKSSRASSLERSMSVARAKADFYGLLYDFKLALEPGNELTAERHALRLAALSPSFAARCVSPLF